MNLAQTQSGRCRSVAILTVTIPACVLLILLASSHLQARDNTEIGEQAYSASSFAATSSGVATRLRAGLQASHATGPNGCALEFLRYEPSAWEMSWSSQAEALKDRICETMLTGENRKLTDVWIEAMPEAFAAGIAASQLPQLQNSSVWSQFVYSNSCNNDILRLPCEPLVGLLRHPTTNIDCKRPDRPDLIDKVHDAPQSAKSHIENKGYMLLQPIAQKDLAGLYPGRKFLFDLGTGRYRSGSLPWFIKMYKRKGITFDTIYGWESKPIPPTEYWQEFPAELTEKMNFRNVGVQSAANAQDNPLNIVRRIYRPGDYIVFKLDIDNAPIEQKLMDQLDDDVIPKIAEFFFEQHFDAPEMVRHFHVFHDVSFPQMLDRFGKFRRRGLRLHYWP